MSSSIICEWPRGANDNGVNQAADNGVNQAAYNGVNQAANK